MQLERTSSWYGVLAPSPTHFIKSHDLIPQYNYQHGPYSITNLGLKIVLPLEHDFRCKIGLSEVIFGTSKHQEFTHAVLSCTKEGDHLRTVAIPLRHIHSNQFVRCPNEHITYVSNRASWGFIQQEIYIMDQPPTPRRLTEDFHSHFSILFLGLPPELEIVDVYPSEFWKPKDMVISGLKENDPERPWHACVLFDVKLERRTRLILVLGVEFPQSPGWKDPFNWFIPFMWNSLFDQVETIEPWCILLDSHGDETLKQVYEAAKSPSYKGRIQDTRDLSHSNWVKARIFAGPLMFGLDTSMICIQLTVGNALSQ